MPYLNLVTKRWSPIKSVSFIEPDGILNAWTINVLMNKARARAIRMASVYSLATDLFLTGFLAAVFLFVIGPQHGEEGLLRDLNFPYPFHFLFAGFLFFEKFSFPGDVPAITFG